MADPRRLREILGFGYGAPSPAMGALEPFHAGVDPAYMPQDVVTESPWEGPRGWVRSGLESLFGTFAPSKNAAAVMADKYTNLSDWINPAQEAWDVGQEIGNTLQGGDPRMLAMSLIPGKAPEKAAKVAKETASTLKDKITDALGGGVIDRTNTGWTFKDYKPINNEMGKGDWRRVDQLDTTEVELPIRSLFAGQKTVNPDFADVPSLPVYGPDNPKATPYAIKKNGQYYLQDGHHRVTALADQGKQTAKVRVVDLDEGPPVETPLLDWTPPAPKDDLVPAVKAAQKGIRAYHGTPHDFDKFDLSKIGTGEGAQAYGHGLYFAENEGVAKGYRDALATDVPTIMVAGRETPLENLTDAQAMALRLSWSKNPEADLANAPQQIADEARKLWEQGVVTQKDPGHMYEVNINADPDAFLDWDKPLMDQPHIRQALGMPESIAPWETLTNEQYNAAADQLGFHIPPHVDDLSKVTGEHFMEAKPRRGYGSPEDRMKAAGIPGIKYLDAGSRSGGEGSRNYVVFSDEIIDIVKKYGIAGALGAGLITQQMADQLQAQQGGGQS